MTTQNVPKRSQAAREYTWNSESVFPSPETWLAELHALQAALPGLEAYRSRLHESPDTLAEALEQRDELLRRVGVVSMWAGVSHEVDKTDGAAAQMTGQSQALFGQALAAVSFVEPEIIAIGPSQIDAWLDTASRLRLYRQYFNDLFRKAAHIRSAEVEQILGMLADPFSGPGTTHGMLVDADFSFAPAVDAEGREQPLAHGSFLKNLASNDRNLRRTSYESYLDEYLAHKNSLTSNLVASMKQNHFLAQARRHASTLEAALFESNIPVDVFTNLIDTFKKNLPTWHRYFAIRRKVLGVDRLAPYDMWAPLSGKRPTVPFKTAIDWICQGLAPLGPEYVETIRRGSLEERWIDVYPNQGKVSGAFSAGAHGTHPFIVMSYTDEIFSLSTLAHELGHSMHSYLTWKNQPAIYGNYSLFVAEVASNFHQAMVRAHLLKTHPDRDFQIGVIEEAMANFYRYFLIMPTLARFELEAHQRIERGEGLNAETAMDLMADLYQEAFGAEVNLDRRRVGIQFGLYAHLYADYYVYQYATGISAAHALAHRILSGTPGAAGDYLQFLSAGASVYPLDALRLAGVEMTSPEPVDQAFAVLASYVERLEYFFR